MKRAITLAMTTLASGVLFAATAVPAGAVGSDPAAAPAPTFQQTNLVSNISTEGAQLVDVNLQNPWGLALSPTSPLWAADNNSGVATLYSIPPGGTSVTKVGLTVNIPGGRTPPPVTGRARPVRSSIRPRVSWSPRRRAAGPAAFIFDSESGQITAWNPTADPITSGLSTGTLEYSSPTAVYKGLTLVTGDNVDVPVCGQLP